MTDPVLGALPPEWLARANRLATVAALLSTTVHEANNALQVISGSAEMLTPDAAPDIIARRAAAIGSQSLRASALLAELTGFARADAPDRQSVDLAAVAQRALSMRQHTFAKLKIRTQVDAGLVPAHALARPWAVLQIVLNLLLNAERAVAGRPDPQIVFTASISGGTSELTIEDSGPGIDPAVIPTLFHASTAAPEPAGGLGIGLSVARWLAEGDGGTLVHSSAGKQLQGGAAFTLALPSR